MPVSFVPFPMGTVLSHLAHPSGSAPVMRTNVLSRNELITQSFIDVNTKTFRSDFQRTSLSKPETMPQSGWFTRLLPLIKRSCSSRDSNRAGQDMFQDNHISMVEPAMYPDSRARISP